MYLFRDVLNKQLLDAAGDKAGRVDDVMLELQPDGNVVVREIVADHGAMQRVFPSWLMRPVAWIEKLILGMDELKPITIDWVHVTKIDVAVHLDLRRRPAGLTQTEEAVWDRWLRSLPWAER